MRSTILYSLLFFSLIASAQTAEVEVSYVETYKTISGSTSSKTWHLLACPSVAKFFNQVSEEIDSICSTPEGTDRMNKLRAAELESDKELTTKPTYMYVFQYPQEESTLYYNQAAGNEKYFYREPWSEIAWEIGDSTKVILGYECIQAGTDYHGRHWTAWFAPEIPLPAGPWKLCGLPGLVLSASDSKGDYSFVADGIEKTQKQIKSMYGVENYHEQSRKEMLKVGRSFLENPVAHLEAMLGISMKDAEVKGELPEINGDWDWYETDYH